MARAARSTGSMSRECYGTKYRCDRSFEVIQPARGREAEGPDDVPLGKVRSRADSFTPIEH
jgi:hypothetical protein